MVSVDLGRCTLFFFLMMNYMKLSNMVWEKLHKKLMD